MEKEWFPLYDEVPDSTSAIVATANITIRAATMQHWIIKT